MNKTVVFLAQDAGWYPLSRVIDCKTLCYRCKAQRQTFGIVNQKRVKRAVSHDK